MFYLTTLNQLDNPSHMTILNEVRDNNFELYIARFINALVQQAYAQTGHLRPIGETTAIRIAQELEQLISVIHYNPPRKLDYSKIMELLRLDFAP